MAVIARVSAPRPKLHGRVVEVHDRRGALAPRDVFDLRVVLWSPVFGAHAHTLRGIKGRQRAYEIAERIGQGPVQVVGAVGSR